MAPATRGRYRPISDYGIIGDTHSTALIAPDGSVDWLCWPRHDSPALFLRILDDGRGGLCTVEGGAGQGEPRPAGRRYLPGTNILETHLAMAGGEATLTDFMPVNPPAPLSEEGPDGEGETRLIRLLRCVSGCVSGWFRVRPAFDYGRLQAGAAAHPDCVLFSAGGHRLRAAGSAPPELRGNEAWIPFSLRQGEEAFLVLTHGEQGREPPVHAEGVAHRLAQSRRYWEEWSARCGYRGPYREMVLRSALCLKLLCYAPSGAIIAAATTSLPEAVGGTRNFDYRLAWMRDASFSVGAFVNLGYLREAAEFMRFLREIGEGPGAELRLLYGIKDPPAPEETLDHLEGYRGSRPVRIGNAAKDQRQHDIYGEFLSSLHLYVDRVGRNLPHSVGRHLKSALRALAEQALARRHEPDHGIWEIRGAPQHYLHTKAMLWRALHSAARTAEIMGYHDLDIAGWDRAAGEIREEYHRRGWSIRRGAFAMAYGSDRLDAAVLRAVLYGAFEPGDPRIAATLEAVQRDLATGDLVRRYDADDGFPEKEGAFAVCSFWLVGCLALMGRTRPAKAMFERLLGRANDLGLYAEEFDLATGEFLGNFPQGFTQMAVINHALRLDGSIARFGLRD
ncbi:glycoside hydrolase family 15 protein [Teichococcus vastitatis]|uniref:Glycoside hydrolase family 15 protein n=1 Tax=Teichococcus vastitatis TaxID=2307076 RepID=A0ABS9W0E8_9PROT|nr:glycoside hydrolase family 15 protein [Pseudoroseomonas vastitatis]MCI0752782.1 glycoside hydrolase family 15 protein [Pseudoroseomonas vastitatis]